MIQNKATALVAEGAKQEFTAAVSARIHRIDDLKASINIEMMVIGGTREHFPQTAVDLFPSRDGDVSLCSIYRR